MDTRIPEKFRKFWVAVEVLPQSLTHYTTPQNAVSIIRDGFITPRDPFPNDWHGFESVFLCDPNDSLYEERMSKTLKTHFFERSNAVTAFHVPSEKLTSIYRCTHPSQTSDYISLDPVSIDGAKYQPSALVAA